MSDTFQYSIRRIGRFRWEWRAYLPQGGVLEGRAFTKDAAKRAAIAGVRRKGRPAPPPPPDEDEGEERQLLHAGARRPWPPPP